MNLDDGSTIKYQIWDSDGQDRYPTLAPTYYRGAAVAIVVYDITDLETFNGAKTYVEELQRVCYKPNASKRTIKRYEERDRISNYD